MSKFLLFTSTAKLDVLVNVEDVSVFTPNPTDENESSVVYRSGEELPVICNFWRIYEALSSALPVVDCQPEETTGATS